jgi:D-alanyl-D-alanine carboxypeptidase
VVNDTTRRAAEALLTRQINTATPGIQYLVLDKQRAVFEFVGGWADIRNRKPMGLDTTLMAYSMTKTFTAVAILQLMEQGKLELDDQVCRYLPGCPYPETITIRQLISHTSGVPNPIPLRWVHLAAAHQRFDERAALAKVLKDNPRLSFKPGTKYAYSNIGYWLLGSIIEAATNQAYIDYVSDHVLKPLGLEPRQIGFVIPDPLNHAKGYLGKYSMMNLLKGFLTEGNLWGDYEGKWLEVASHYVNGPAFGGLIGGVRSFGRFLQDQLRESSILLGPAGKELLFTEQKTSDGRSLGMTLGWHIRELQGVPYFLKEGGGGGFHGEMRLYPTRQFASVVLVNSTEFNSNTFLSQLDTAFLEAQ